MKHLALTLTALALAYSLDLVLGDPPKMPHPVRVIGKVVTFLEGFVRTHFRGQAAEKLAGVAIVILTAGGSGLLVYFALAGARRLHFLYGLALSTYIFYAMLAVKDMAFHVQKVKEALAKKNLDLARDKVGMLVSRDTAGLGETGVVRAALESLFENTADGVVAPLFYAALGGPVLAVVYKAVSTLDSMLGYKTARYCHLGWAAARADDLLGFIPARLAAVIFILAGALSSLDWKSGWKTLLQDRKKHESPNSAWPEAAAAGVLGIRLGGADIYQGQKKHRPILNEAGRPPRCGDLATALALFKKVSFLALLAALLMIILIKYIAG